MTLYEYLTKEKGYDDNIARNVCINWELDLPMVRKEDEKIAYEWWNIQWKGENNEQKLERTKNKTNKHKINRMGI